MSALLAGKTALVTGASRGIGRACATALSAQGARLLVHYGQSAADAESLVAQVRAAGGRADAVAADLGAPDGAHSLAARVRDLVDGELHVLVANAGVSKLARLEDTTADDFERLFAVNVRAPYFLVQQLLPLFKPGASVVFVSSVVARAVVGPLSAYAATKGAVNTLVKYLAGELGPRGVRVNAVAPGVIDTDMSNFTKTESGQATALAMQALQRIGQPADVADVVAFFASDAARWVTGEILEAGGGSKL